VVAGALAVAPVAGADQWYKTDTHVHSAVSGDATDDIGIISQAAKDRGYDALMLTDHTATSNNEIGGVVANNVTLDETDFQNWTYRAFGTLTSFVDAEAASPVNTGVKSLHQSATTSSSTYGESFRWYKRGANLRTGDSILKFSVYPTRIDPGTGMYVSLSLGGDPTITSRPPQGYTTNDGVIHPGKTNVLVWQLGNVRTPSSDPNNRVTTHQLGYTLNQWNSYTINVSQAIRDEIPAAEMPMDLNAITQLKMATGGQGGTADGYFDTYNLKAQAPITSPNEFVYRNTHVADFNTSTFKIFPSQEVGYNRHAMRFNFGITDPSQYVLFKPGQTSIPVTQASGYPAQLNHPGLPGGVTQQEAIDNLAYGADFMEAAERSDEEGYIKNVMVDAWDGVLKQGTQLLGMWTSDMHRVERLGPATYVQASALDFDPLMQGMYEGRDYLAGNDFPGRAIFNLDGGPNPYAARYPTYVSPSQTLANVHFQITAGITTGSKVIWTSNGQQISVDNVNGPSYDGLKSIPLGGAFTYVRAELRNANGARIAMSQPIFFTDAPGLIPLGMNYNVTRVTTPSGIGYNKTMTQGITSSGWDAGLRRLSLGLTNPSGSLVATRIRTAGFDPGAITVDGTPVAPAASQAAFDAATASSWWFDSAKHVLLLKVKQSGGTAAVAVTFVPGADAQIPAAPQNLRASSHGAQRIDLTWDASSSGDIEGYTVYRNGQALAITAPGTTQFSDSTLAAGTHYTYTVDAYDSAENHSPASNPAGATTDVVTILTYLPVADAYVDESHPTTKYGTSTALRVDGTPLIRSYMRFDLSGISGTIEKVTLRVFNTSNSGGYDVHSADNAWVENTTTWNNAPAPSDTLYGSSNGGLAGAWSTADVTPLVTGNGTVTAEIDTIDTTAIGFSSRQGTQPPQLVVETSTPSNDPPVASDVSADSAGAWTPSVHDPDADTLTCSIVTQPAHGTATVQPDCSGGTYNPAIGYAGPDSFTYKATDSHSADSNAATVSATAVATNHAPTATDRTLTTDEDMQGSWTPSVGDVDPGDTTTCEIVSPPAHGTATVASNCSSGTYTPAGDFNGADSFSYRAVDSHNAPSNSATVAATVNSVNDAPSAASTSVTTVQDVAGSWTPSVSDIENDALTCEIVDQPAHGSASVASDCSNATYTPAAGYTGGDSFTYRATDSHGAHSNTATVSATVNPPNHAPAAVNRSLTTPQGTAASWTPAVSDADSGDTLTCEVVGQPAHGTASVASNCSSGSYTPANGFSGDDPFTYRATDNHGAHSNTATVTPSVVVVSLFEDGFESGNLTAWNTTRAMVVQSAIAGNGTYSARGQTANGASYAKRTLSSTQNDVVYRLRFRAESAPSSTATIVRLRSAADKALVGLNLTSARKLGMRNEVAATGVTSATTTLTAGQWYDLELHAIVNGASSTIEVRLNGTKLNDLSTTSANLGTAGVGIVQIGENAAGPSMDYLYDNVAVLSGVAPPMNHPPTAADRSLTTSEDTQGSWVPSVSDPDGDTQTCEIVTAPAHGSATVAANCSTGTYTPAADYSGSDSFTYRSADSGAHSNAATVSATVTAVNDGPSVSATSMSTDEDQSGSWTPSVSDPEGEALTCEIVSPPAHGSAGVQPDCSSGTYSPAGDYNGSDSFSYRAVDPHGAPSGSAAVAATVNAVNDAPSAAGRTLTTTQDVAGSWTPSVSDVEGDTVSCEIVDQPAHGAATVASDCSSGSYTPAAGYTGSDSFTYRALDSHNAPSTAATVDATVTAPNSAPTADDRSVSTGSDVAGTWTPSVHDADSGDTLTCEIVDQPGHGSASVAPDCSSGSYMPAAGYTGGDSFSYRATDNHGAHSNTATVSATVTAPNHPPAAADRTLTTNQDTTGSWTPSASDTDSGDTLTCEIVDQPAHGSAAVNPDCSTGSYTPASGFSGSDPFTYRATDNHGAHSNTATVTATVVVPPLFTDGFESGTMTAWTSNRALSVQSAIVNSGTYAARGQSTNGASWAKKTLPGTYTDVTYRVRFRAEGAAPTGSPTIMRFRTAADKAIAGLYLSSTRKLGLRNDVAATSTASTTTLALGQWYDLELHAIVNGTSSTIEVKLNGTKLNDVSSTTANLGAVGINMLQIGENATGPTYDFLYDDIDARR
jgi:hypothetical protein